MEKTFNVTEVEATLMLTALSNFVSNEYKKISDCIGLCENSDIYLREHLETKIKNLQNLQLQANTLFLDSVLKNNSVDKTLLSITKDVNVMEEIHMLCHHAIMNEVSELEKKERFLMEITSREPFYGKPERTENNSFISGIVGRRINVYRELSKMIRSATMLAFASTEN